jgi:hypothetical protein
MRRQYYNQTSFLDLLFNFLLATTILLVIAVLHIVIENNKADIQRDAEYILTMTWDKKIDADMDIWVKDPRGDLLWYRQKEIGVMHLDRDDKGHIGNDWVTTELGDIIYNPNQEIVTIRGVIPGEWIINLHLFRVLSTVYLPCEVDVTLIKLNPKATTILNKKLVFNEYWEQQTVARLDISESGDILSVEDGPFIDMIEDKVTRSSSTPPRGGPGP